MSKNDMNTITMVKGLVQPMVKFFDAFVVLCESNNIPLDKECFVATAGIMYDEDKITAECFQMDDFFAEYKKQMLKLYFNK